MSQEFYNSNPPNAICVFLGEFHSIDLIIALNLGISNPTKPYLYPYKATRRIDIWNCYPNPVNPWLYHCTSGSSRHA